jgi:hypothetical protein
MVKKRGKKFCVLHGSPQKPGSKIDKPAGSVIKCFPTPKQAEKMHSAIQISKAKRKK